MAIGSPGVKGLPRGGGAKPVAPGHPMHSGRSKLRTLRLTLH